MKDDLLMIKWIRAVDEDAAEELVRKFYAQVMRFCRWQCSNNDLAENLTQETFLKVFKSLDQYRNRGHIKAWIFCVARSVCVDELRNRCYPAITLVLWYFYIWFFYGSKSAKWVFGLPRK